jgi:rod shape-determining protein MreD
MRWLRFAILILIATIIQAELIKMIAISNIKPDLLIILLVFFAIYSTTTEAIIISFIIGIASDLIGPAMGPGMISLGLFGTLLAYLHRVIAIRKKPYQAAAIFITCLLAGILTYLLKLMITNSTSQQEFFSALFKTSLYSALVGPFFFLPCAWVMRIKTNRFNNR